jgi:hypothetical protein
VAAILKSSIREARKTLSNHHVIRTAIAIILQQKSKNVCSHFQGKRTISILKISTHKNLDILILLIYYLKYIKNQI